MKLLLIKIGKAFNTIKRDGLLRGGRRVFQSTKALFGRVKPGDVLFIAGGVGDSARYGCQHQAEELEVHGIKCSITVQDNPFLTNYVDKFQVFIFHRTLYTPSVQKLIEKIKATGKTIIYATDDLVFDPQYNQYMDYLANANKFEKMLYENGVGGEILQDPYTEAAVTTTSFLADKMTDYVKRHRTAMGISNIKFQAYVSLNKMSQEDVRIAQAILEQQQWKDDGLVRVGYFSGTISHNKDFATVANVLMELLEKYPQMRLVLVGYLDPGDKLHQFSSQIEQLPFVPRKKHFANIASVDISIAPLETKNPFCQAKSELKFFEAGLVKVPSVVSGTRTFQEAMVDGIDGFVANNETEWKERIEKLLLDQTLRQQMGQKAFEKVMAQYVTTGDGNEKYYDYLKSKIKHG